MSTITLNVDSRFENLVKGMGMSVAQALKEFMDRSVNNKCLDLSVSREKDYTTDDFNEETLQAIKDVEEENFSHTFNTIDEYKKFVRSL